MRHIMRPFYAPVRLLIILLFAPILTIVYWIIVLPLVFPIYIFRNILSYFAHLIDPDLCKIVNSMGHILSRDYKDWFQSPSQTVTVVFKITGSFTVNEMRELFTEKLLHKTDMNHQLSYPELQQYITKRWGYLFFKWDRTFDISNHIKVYSHKELLPNHLASTVNDETLVKVWENIMTKPFMEKRSPWDITLIPNYIPSSSTNTPNNDEEKQSLVILRFHHGLSDGIAIYKILLTLTDDGLKNLEKDVAAFRKVPNYMTLLLHLKAFFCGPTSFVNKFTQGIDIFNPLHRPLGKKTGRGHILITTIDLEKIKKITQVHLDVSFHSVLIAAIAGGIRNYFLENGHKIPLSPVRVGLPIPQPGHTHKLRNEYLVTLLNLPVHKKTPKQRLFATEKKLNDVPSESFMPFMAQTWRLLGLFPVALCRFLTLKAAITVLYSEIKGPTRLLTIKNGQYTLLDLIFSFGLGPDDLGIGFSSLSYNGKIHLVLTVDHGVSETREKAQHLMNLIVEELEELQYGDSTNL